MVKAVTQTAPDVDIGWSRRRHASRRRSDGVRHKLVPEVGYQRFLFVRWTSRIKFFTLNRKAQMGQVHVQKFVRMKNVSGNFAAVGPANATIEDTVARSTRQRGSSSFEGTEDWVRALPSTTVQLTNKIPNIQLTGRIGGIDVQRMPSAVEDMSLPGVVHERRMNDPSRNVTQSRNPLVQESTQVTSHGNREVVPRSYEEVRDSINWKEEVILLRESLALMHKRLEEMSAPVIERTELPGGETTRSPCVRGHEEEVQRKPQT